MCSIRDIGKTNINELCFNLLLATLQNKSTEIGMNVNNTVQRIHQYIIQTFILPYKTIVKFRQFCKAILHFQDYGALIATTSTFFSLFTVFSGRERLNPWLSISFNSMLHVVHEAYFGYRETRLMAVLLHTLNL